jgi:hypothetical protein
VPDSSTKIGANTWPGATIRSTTGKFICWLPGPQRAGVVGLLQNVVTQPTMTAPPVSGGPIVLMKVWEPSVADRLLG